MGKTGKVSNKKRIVVIFASEDLELAEHLVEGLRSPVFEVWFSEEITNGNWPIQARAEIDSCDALVPLVTRSTLDKAIFIDEWGRAAARDCPIFPFTIDTAGTPLGMGQYNRTEAHEWNGSPKHPALERLKKKLLRHFEHSQNPTERFASLSVGEKSLQLPSFIFSLSTFETQLDPIDGLELMGTLLPAACLFSAYDVFGECTKGPGSRFWKSFKALKGSNSVTFLDSGNYEATRKGDHKSKKNIDGWCAEKFHETAREVSADIVFSYDMMKTQDTEEETIKAILKTYAVDQSKITLNPEVLCPIVHVPTALRLGGKGTAYIAARVAREVKPRFIAIPERELGDGILARMGAVKLIRKSLNELGYYQPLHILGTGNPITIAALSVCGGDSFDGLEWCRTAANYETNNLMHFQQFDLLKKAFGSRIKSPAARSIVELEAAPFALRVASYNYDYFCDWMITVQGFVQTENPERLFNGIHYLGSDLAAECKYEVK